MHGATHDQQPLAAREHPTRPRILFLYTEAMSYTEALVRALVREHDAAVTLVSRDGNLKRTPHRIEIAGVETLARSTLSDDSLRKLIDRQQPSIMYVSGWMDGAYLSASRYARSRGIRVVAGIDTPWRGSLRQRASALLLKGFWRAHFDYVWVPGARQERYAVRLGFPGRTLHHLLSADTDLFAASWQRASASKQAAYPRRLLFAGRLAPEKGLSLLVQAFREAKAETSRDWRLVVAGAGPLLHLLPRAEDVEYAGFKTPSELASLMDDCGAFCLPSLREPWGVAIHEAAAAGLPLVVSEACGAAERFLRDGENGYIVRTGLLSDLSARLAKLMALADPQLLAMARQSHALSHSLTPSRSAAMLVSLLDPQPAVLERRRPSGHPARLRPGRRVHRPRRRA